MAMTFDEILAQVLELLQREKRLSYRALKVRFGLDDDHLEALKDEIIEAKQLAVDDSGKVLVWTGGPAPPDPPGPALHHSRHPVLPSPQSLREQDPQRQQHPGWRAQASHRPCLPTSKTRQSLWVASIPKPPSSSWTLPCIT